MFKTAISAATLLTSFVSVAHAIDVYPGCDKPVLKAGHRTFYVDPVKGTDAGDGSAAKPWRNLQNVIGTSSKLLSTVANVRNALTEINSNAPIKPGDIVMLMNGNYGDLTIFNQFNKDFVTIMPAPGQVPVIGHLSVASAGRWLFQGLKFQAFTRNPKGFDTLVVVADQYAGKTTNIIFSNGSFSTTDDTSNWSPQDWVQKPAFTSLDVKASCVSVVNNHFYNVFNGTALMGSQLLAQGNRVERFSNDGIDINGSDITIKGNIILAGVNDAGADGQHADAIQGWSDRVGASFVWNRNVTIDSNTIVKFGDPNKSYLQGISIFDGWWDNLTVENNVVANNTYNGITVLGLQNSKLINNTVVATAPNQQMNMIRIAPAKDGMHTKNVVVRNNIAPILAMSDSGVVYDHNLIANKFMTYENGKSVTRSTSDVANQNIMISSVSPLFSQFDLNQGKVDLHLKTGSAAIGAGSALMVPSVDITGRTRAMPIDIGAYTR